jgi:hypothetical protein
MAKFIKEKNFVIVAQGGHKHMHVIHHSSPLANMDTFAVREKLNVS